MEISEAGIALIKQFEGCHEAAGSGRFRAYLCPAGRPTIGFGHTNDHGRKFNMATVWTRADCEEALAEDLSYFSREVAKRIKVELEQHQFDAICSLAYNIGLGGLEQSTVLRKLNRRDFDGAARGFALWNKITQHGKKVVCRGLVRRRAAEEKMFRGAGEDDDERMPQAVAAPDVKSPAQSKTIWTSVTMAASGIFAVYGEVFEQVKDIIYDPITLIILTTIFVAGGLFIAHDRTKKINEEGV